jgi:hypothetical protein
MAAATKYQCLLYMFNLFLMGVGITLIVWGIEKVDPNWDMLMEGLLSTAVWPLSSFAGAALLALGLLGCAGATRAKRNISTNSCSCALGLYGTAIFVALAATGAITALAGTYIYALNNEVDMGYNSTSPSSIDMAVMDTLRANPQPWIELQDAENCCSWGALDDDLATGSRCPGVNATDPTDQTCRDKLIMSGSDAMWMVTVVAAGTFFILLMVLTSVCCLTCCSKKQDALDDQGYRQMPGGSARGGGYV